MDVRMGRGPMDVRMGMEVIACVNKPTDRQTDRQTDRKTDGQTDRQTNERKTTKTSCPDAVHVSWHVCLARAGCPNCLARNYSRGSSRTHLGNYE